MTEYKRRFVNAFDAIKPVSSDTEFVNGILERTKIMKTHEEEVKIYGAKVYETPKAEKRSRVFTAIAGTAAAVAIVSVGAVGITLLNKYGGLKGPDVQGGAGYSANAETTTTAVPYYEHDLLTTTANALPPDDTVTDYYNIGESYCCVGDYILHFTGYEFNTVLLRVYYEVSRADGAALTDEDMKNIPSCAHNGYPYIVVGQHMTDSSDTFKKYVVDIIPDEPAHRLDVYFAAGTGEFQLFTAQCDNSNYVFRLPCDIEGVDPRISELFISWSEAIIKYRYDLGENGDAELPSVRVYMKGDYPIAFADSNGTFYDPDKKIGYQFRGFAEPCDTSNIGRVYVGDVLVYEAPDIQYPASAAEEPSGYAVTQTRPSDTPERAELFDFSSRTVSMEWYRYDGHILAAKLVGEADMINGKSLAFRSVSDPRNLIQGCVQEDGGTYTLWALLDVPEGQTDTIEIVEIPPESEGYEVGATITVDGIATASPGIILDADMSGYGLPGVTLESMRLSTYGLELMFSCEKSNGAHELHVEILLGDVMVPIKEISGMVPYDEADGLYHACMVVTADNMFGFDLSAASSVSVNGLKVSGDELTPGGADDRPGIYDIMPRRNAAE